VLVQKMKKKKKPRCRSSDEGTHWGEVKEVIIVTDDDPSVPPAHGATCEEEPLCCLFPWTPLALGPAVAHLPVYNGTFAFRRKRLAPF
jgi:hypothetical protein